MSSPVDQEDFLAYTQEWREPARVSALFHTLPPSRDADSASWDDKMRFWEAAITEYCRRKRVLQVSASELRAAFTRKRDGLTPRGIEQVLTELQRQQKTVRPEDLNKRGQGGLASKAVGYVFGWWGSTATVAPETHLMLVSSVEREAHSLLEAVRKDAHLPSDFILPLERVTELSGLSATDAKLVVSFLASKGQAATADNGVVYGVKFAAPGAVATWDAQADNGVVAVKHAIGRLEATLSELEAKTVDALAKAKAALKRNQKKEAILHLKRKNNFQKMEELKRKHLDNLSEILLHIQQAETTKQLAVAYKTASATLRHELKHADKHVDELHTTRDELSELLLEFEDAQAAMKMPEDDAANEELEAEFEQLMAAGAGSVPSAHAAGTPVGPAAAATTMPAVGTDVDDLEARLKRLQLPPQTEPQAARPAAAKPAATKLLVHEM